MCPWSADPLGRDVNWPRPGEQARALHPCAPFCCQSATSCADGTPREASARNDPPSRDLTCTKNGSLSRLSKLAGFSKIDPEKLVLPNHPLRCLRLSSVAVSTESGNLGTAQSDSNPCRVHCERNTQPFLLVLRECGNELSQALVP